MYSGPVQPVRARWTNTANVHAGEDAGFLIQCKFRYIRQAGRPCRIYRIRCRFNPWPRLWTARSVSSCFGPDRESAHSL